MQQSDLVERASHFEWFRSSYTDLWDWMMEARVEIERLRALVGDGQVKEASQ